MSSQEGSSTQTQKKNKFYRRQEFIPILIFIILFFLLAISTSLSGYPPSIEKISRENNINSYIVKIYGRNFGDKKSSSEVFIQDLAVTASAYLKWSDNLIIIGIPKEIKSGLLYVISKAGRTNGVIYTNPDEIPEPVSAMYQKERPVQQNKPIIRSITPLLAKIGNVITLSGSGFGKEKGPSRILFSWISQSKIADTDEESSPVLPAKENDYDYVMWSDKEIQVRIPDGAISGNVYLESERGLSNAKYLEIQHPYGEKRYQRRNKYSIKYSILIKNVKAEPNNGIYLWIPKILEGAEQRDISYLKNNGPFETVFDDFNGVMLYYLPELKNNNQYEISIEGIFDRYAIETKINPDLINKNYDKNSEFYHHFTAENHYLKPDLPEIQKLKIAIIGNENNPYFAAYKIYEYIINNFSFSYVNPYIYEIWPSVMESKQGDSFIYTVLFCTLCRSAGIPARPIAGYIIDNDKRSIRHFWAEFYLPEMGWIPVDPLLGDNQEYGTFPSVGEAKSFYFGNLDNQHLTFSKDLVELKKMNPDGRIIHQSGLANLQSIHEEVIGNLYDYSISWQDIKVLGIF
jgi:hypothetical protein